MIGALIYNPYRDCDFFSFFSVLFIRGLGLLSGQIGIENLASDEIQILVLIGLCLSSAFIGVFLVLKQMTMMANALCHTILLGIVLAFLLLHPFISSHDVAVSFIPLKVLLLASFISALLTTIFTQLLIQVTKVQEDASIGLVFTFLFAIAVVLVTLYTKNMHIGTEAIMGNIDALDVDDVYVVSLVALLNCVVFSIGFKGFTTVTFDPLFAKSVGLSTAFFNYFMMFLTAATCIAAFRAVGVLLVLTFFVGPPLMARFFTNQMKKLVLLSFLIPSVASIASVALSRHILFVYHTPVSTAGLVVCVFTLIYLALILFFPKKGLISSIFNKKACKRF
ncbi:MAG: metal ABC transporter permease [Chlamydiae bacterium]|nr:metal ABC transporter permease [Chlamydiota bacterium]